MSFEKNCVTEEKELLKMSKFSAALKHKGER